MAVKKKLMIDDVDVCLFNIFVKPFDIIYIKSVFVEFCISAPLN